MGHFSKNFSLFQLFIDNPYVMCKWRAMPDASLIVNLMIHNYFLLTAEL